LYARQIAVAMQAEVLLALPEEARERFLANLEAVADACKLAADLSPKRKKAGS